MNKILITNTNYLGDFLLFLLICAQHGSNSVQCISDFQLFFSSLELPHPAENVKQVLQRVPAPVFLDIKLGPAPGDFDILRMYLPAVRIYKEPAVVHSIMRIPVLREFLVGMPLIRNNGGALLAPPLYDGNECFGVPLVDYLHVDQFPLSLVESEDPAVPVESSDPVLSGLEAGLVDLHHAPEAGQGLLVVLRHYAPHLGHHRVGGGGLDVAQLGDVGVGDVEHPQEDRQHHLAGGQFVGLPDTGLRVVLHLAAVADEEEVLALALQTAGLAALAGKGGLYQVLLEQEGQRKLGVVD